jgi:hypothetical protein
MKDVCGEQFCRTRHGGLHDRGSADAYYSRPAQPHWWPSGTGFGEKVTDLTPEEVAEYLIGYASIQDLKEWDCE